MGSKVIRNVTKILKATSGRLFGRVTAGTGRAEELTPADVRTLLEVATTTQIAAAYQPIGSYQETLVSGTNIKTVNSTSLLGSGDIVVSASPAGSSGQVQFNNAGSFGGATAVVYAGSGTHVMVTAQSSTAIPLCVKGAASQSGNLQEWQNSSGTILGRVSSAGAIIGASFTGSTFTGTAYNTGFILHDGNGNLIARQRAYPGGTRYSPEMNCYDDFEISVGAGRAVSIGPAFSSSPVAQRVQATGGNGTNIAGSKLTIHPGQSSGNATPAILALATTTVTTSGTTVQTLRDVMQCDGNTTAGETPMLLLDIDKGTLQRVSIGASDSGGAGFKVLRVPN
jgi:hypothetical protein